MKVFRHTNIILRTLISNYQRCNRKEKKREDEEEKFGKIAEKRWKRMSGMKDLSRGRQDWKKWIKSSRMLFRHLSRVQEESGKKISGVFNGNSEITKLRQNLKKKFLQKYIIIFLSVPITKLKLWENSETKANAQELI